MDSVDLHLKYEQKEYTSLEEMSKALLHEANEVIIKIDMGRYPNDVPSRNQAKFRLMHLQRNFPTCIPVNCKVMYNSLWSQLYRLECEDGYVNPFLKSILAKINESEK